MDTISVDPEAYLSSCEIIDFCDPSITELSSTLRCDSQTETAKRCFEFVRDQIRHSADYELNPVTSRASEVLRDRTGYCYAKSHLLAALLRANAMPAGLCYQRLTINGASPPFCLHGLNAVYLPDIGWYRVDARGNRDGIDAQFCPPTERLAFPIVHAGEYDLPDIYIHPLGEVMDCLHRCYDWAEVYSSLPDISSSDTSPV